MGKKKQKEQGSVAVLDAPPVQPDAGILGTLPEQQETQQPSASETALVVLSGGQDSTTCLFWARQKFKRVLAVTFAYGQKHAVELRAAIRVASLAKIPAFDHEVLELSAATRTPSGGVGPAKVLMGTSPLLHSHQKVAHYSGPDALPGGLEATFVPMRNAFFLVLAANRAVVRGASHIVTGVCQEDFGGYPDCRQEFINSVQHTINTALGNEQGGESFIVVDTPLMNLSKKDAVLLANSLPGCMDALAFSHTCYEGLYPPGPHNHASILRAKGFKEAGLPDPLILRAKREGILPKDYPDHGLVEGTKYALKG